MFDKSLFRPTFVRQVTFPTDNCPTSHLSDQQLSPKSPFRPTMLRPVACPTSHLSNKSPFGQITFLTSHPVRQVLFPTSHPFHQVTTSDLSDKSHLSDESPFRQDTTSHLADKSPSRQGTSHLSGKSPFRQVASPTSHLYDKSS